MDEKEIREKLLKEDGNYEIKTSSTQILEAYQEQHQESVDTRRVGRTRKIGLISIVASLVCGVVIGVVVFNRLDKDKPYVPPGPDNTSAVLVNPQVGVKNGTRAQAAFQVYTGLQLISSLDSELYEIHRNYNAPRWYIPSKEEAAFNGSTDALEKAFDSFSAFIKGDIALPNTIYNGQFLVQEKEYPYCITMTIGTNEVMFYTDMTFEEDDDETTKTYNGVAYYQGSLYGLLIEDEYDIEDGEREIDMTISLPHSNDTLEISQETEGTEREYSYTYKKEGKVYYSEEFSFEEPDEDEKGETGVEIVITTYGQTYTNVYEFVSLAPGDYTYQFEYTVDDEDFGIICINDFTTYRRYIDIEHDLTRDYMKV